MTLQILVLVFIIVLLGYIIFLHIQLAKKNGFIESTVSRLSGIEKNQSLEEMMAFLSEIQKSSQYSLYFPDKFPDPAAITFIFENEKELKTYMHYTKEESDAKNILLNGFKFAESFYKTALPVSKDNLDLTIKHNSRKFFGNYLIIICISNDIVNFYSMELEKAGVRNYSFENILTETPPLLNDNSEIVYQLSPRFIKGYINYRTGEIFNNPEFDPWYDSPSFIKNIELLSNR
ncbi:MAG TPA: hypothetical protein VIK07_00730 [Bacteroidales bacterium]